MGKENNKFLKVGLFGASFNPLHLAHLNVIISAQEKFDFDIIKVVPAFETPWNTQETDIKEPSPFERFSIVKSFLQGIPFVEVNNQEIRRKGISYTYLTVSNIKKTSKECFLIIGLDQMAMFNRWKNYKKILKSSHLVVCSRKPYSWPDHLPKEISSMITKRYRHRVLLNTGTRIHYLSLSDMDISASLIRKRLRKGLRVEHLVPEEVNRWIACNQFYT